MPMPRSTRPKKVRYAVVGLGYIAQIAVLPAFANARRNSELAALVSDDPVKLKTLGKRYGVPRTYSYAAFSECLTSGEIDAVYIALPNHMHRDYAIMAAQAGIHILCEKPLAVTERECEDMIDAAERHDVRLMTAYRLHFEKANLKAIEIARSGKLGDVSVFHSAFTTPVDKEDNIRLNPAELGGGPLYDIGVYCINAARYLFRAEPVEAAAMTIPGTDRRFKDVDPVAAGLLRFPGNRVASFVCSFGAADSGWYQVLGTKGDLCVDSAYEYSEEITHCLTIGDRTKETNYPKRDQFGPELVYFSNCILEGKTPEPSGVEGLADVRIVRALLHAARSGETVTLEPFEKTRRPTMTQEQKRPAIRKPKLVHASAPSEE
jgi:glucose-fructose oxidoreductase